MGRRGHGPPPGLRQNPPGPGRYHSTFPHLPSPRPSRWTPPLSLTSASTVAMAGAPERSPAPSAAPHALAPPLSPHSSQWRRSAGHCACVRQHGGPHGAPWPYGVMAAPVRRLPYSWDDDGVTRGQGRDGDSGHRHPLARLFAVCTKSPQGGGFGPSPRGVYPTSHSSSSAV